MESGAKTSITVATTIDASLEKVWQYWNLPEHITQWYNASEDWHTPRAENNLQTGGKFLFRMEAKDGSFGFDLEGVYEEIKTNTLIKYTLADGRKVVIDFKGKDGQTTVIETFEAEDVNSIELQRGGWQAILDNFKKYVEAN